MRLILGGDTGGYLDNQLSPERTINFYQKLLPNGQDYSLISVPGTKLVYTNPTGDKTRALFSDKNDLSMFAVYENKVVIHDSLLNATTIGTLNSTQGSVGIESNNVKQITFVDGLDGWVYDYSTNPETFTQITSDGFPENPIDVTFLDGHMIIAAGGTNRWYISNISDAKNYNALNFAALTSDEEKIVAVQTVNRRIFIFGTYITEIFYNSGNASSFPFVRDNNNVLQFGCAAVGSVAQDENKLVWLATQKNGGPSVRVTEGGPGIRISNDAVEQSLQSFTNYSQIIGYLQKINGHTFYILNNPVDNITWAYDFETKFWHKLEMVNGDCYFASCHTFYRGKHYLGHLTKPSIYENSSKYETNNGEIIHCLRITQPITETDLQRIRIERLEITGAMGRGFSRYVNNDNYYSDPRIYLSVSKDMGYSFSQPIIRSLGKSGQYNWEVIYLNLGISKSATYKIETFNPIRTILTRAQHTVTPIGY